MTPVYLASSSAEDDAAYIALHDVSRPLTDARDGCIIGGHMVSLLCALHPSTGFVERRTGDADAGIPVHLAQSGNIHDALVRAGYQGERGNRYVRRDAAPPWPTIDLLIPAARSTFESEEHGGRSFDAMPGLRFALAAPQKLDVVAMMRDGSELCFSTRVPTVEAAVILKASSWASRSAQRDAVDLHNLFRIVGEGQAIGPWRLSQDTLTGARRDAARHLHALADAWETRAPVVRFDPRLLVSAIRRYVTRPSGEGGRSAVRVG